MCVEKKNKILFVEPEIGGHQIDHITYICDYYCHNNIKNNIFFLVNPKINYEIEYRGVKNKFDLYKKKGIKFVTINSYEFSQYNNKNLFISSFYKLYITIKYAKILQVNWIHFLYIDHLQLSLAIRINNKNKYSISGTLFRLTSHYSKMFGIKENLRNRIKNIRKNILYGLMLRNRNVIKIFSLDPYFVEYGKNKFNKGDKLEKLTDPSLFKQFRNQFINDFKEIKFLKNRITFLLFGHLSKRKGIFQILYSLKLLSDPYIKKSQFVFCGKIDKNIEISFLNKVENLKKNINNLEIKIVNKIVSNKYLFSLIYKSDCILIPYQYFNGSSAAIFWASGAGKPVICQDYGLLGKWVKDYNLGLTVDSTKPIKISNAIQYFIENKNNIGNKESMKNFSKNHTPERFAKTIFMPIIKGDKEA